MAETLPAEVVEKMHAPPKPWDGCVRMRVPVCMSVLCCAVQGSRGVKGSCEPSPLFFYSSTHPPNQPTHRPPRFFLFLFLH